jgi:hypothetical protein
MLERIIGVNDSLIKTRPGFEDYKDFSTRQLDKIPHKDQKKQRKIICIIYLNMINFKDEIDGFFLGMRRKETKFQHFYYSCI